ncbi:Mannose-binding lectin [Glarea lozoyensis ATCC 20868]|uniref:Mannose-binding lectin n=1 Tax=Glarea lozoyensis (strain ATCC 20868 / MF5171) TaxID=1116229 RepID=S3CUL7_GLAL2|nr:Mannose-binding lectin [Glarea lozoyensis ATCC 20868]EPE28689.1 Mannose-binding lectin [Glarea lozoyensis ATCC 20868]
MFNQDPEDDRWGIPFHASCWSLLERVYGPDEIPSAALLEICKSLPLPLLGDCIDWGHDFEGLFRPDDQVRYPWEDRSITLVDADSPIGRSARNDPYNVPEIAQLLGENPQAPPASNLLEPAKVANDCFAALPEDVCFIIASNMPTVDALKLRHASASFWPIFRSQQFWGLKFKASGERSWLCESQKLDKSYNWLWLYHRTNRAQRSEKLQNRRRIWKLVEQIRESLDFERTNLPLTFCSDPNLANMRWLEVTGDIRPEREEPYTGFFEGCRLLYEQQTSIHPSLSEIEFSFVPLGSVSYVAGIRLLSSSCEAIQLGYRAHRSERVNIKSLIGFNLVVGSRGIQAVQCIVNNSEVSKWFGCLSDAPTTRRLTLSAPITAVKAGFDGCKMISLAIADSCSRDPENESLRDLAMWYPSVPPINLHLHEACFEARKSAVNRFQPLCWTLFGGHGGKYLQSLTGVTVTYRARVSGVEFNYNTEQVPAECRKVGRYRPHTFDTVSYFPIDGAGGEYIDTIHLFRTFSSGAEMYWYQKIGKLKSFKISTNRGRSCHFNQRDSGRVGECVTLVPGTTVTGFYWSQRESHITDLGVISETIDQK